MIAFRTLPDGAPELDLCPLLRAAQMTLQYAVEHGGIELTQTKAFKRVFVHWAAEHINWPGMGYEELFRYNKVLNEYEFPPLEITHFLLTQLKLGRHYKGRFKATKKGATLAGQRGKLFGELVPFFLFSIDHASYSRFSEQPVGNWDTWLNVINVEADHGADQKQIFKTFYGYEASFAEGNWREAAVFSSCVLHPLEWAGFLDHIETKNADELTERHYVKTDLWRSALSLDTDDLLKPVQRH
jgi:hypothetical protein